MEMNYTHIGGYESKDEADHMAKSNINGAIVQLQDDGRHHVFQVDKQQAPIKSGAFECKNCGNKPCPLDVVENHGVCSICGDTVIAYTVDVAEMIVELTA